MSKVVIKYRKLKHYKYQLMEKHVHETKMGLPKAIALEGGWVRMTSTGRLTLKEGYAWDGPSGPTIDTKNFMRASLVHDALYQLMREGQLPGRLRKWADEMLRDLCLEDGMSKVRADYVYAAVRAFAGGAVRRRKKRRTKILTAP